MFRDPCETRVFGDPCVGREGDRLVCYRNRVLLARSCVQCAREHVVTVCSDFIECMGDMYRRVVFRTSELQRLLKHTVHVRTAKRHGTVQAIDM